MITVADDGIQFGQHAFRVNDHVAGMQQCFLKLCGRYGIHFRSPP